MKTISAKAVIGKVLRDVRPASKSFEYDAMQWIGEAIEFIGHHAGFVPQTETLTVTDNRALLPCNYYLVRPKGVRYNGVPLVYGYNGGAYEPDSAPTYISQLNVDGDTSITEKYGRPVEASHRASDEYYMLNNNYIITSFESGEITMKFWAFPVGEDGFPFIPDNIYYKEALMWYVISKLIMGGMRHPIFSYDFAYNKWLTYCSSAANDIAFPTPDQMDKFTANWARLIPASGLEEDDYYEHDTTV